MPGTVGAGHNVEVMKRLHNDVRPYAWGSTTAIPDLLGIPATGGPMAEMWLGAHPEAPSHLDDGQALDEALASAPAAMLGEAVARRFDGGLPYLMKVLAAAQPLSLQVHPTTEQARTGFALENAAGVPLDSPTRNYKDPRHKPEMLVALTPFDALSGFRSPGRARAALASILGEPEDQPFWQRLSITLASQDARTGLSGALEQLLTGGEEAERFARSLMEASHDASGEDAETVRLLGRFYPGDPGVAAALLLNRVHLLPGQALFLDAGIVHAYLSGLGIEVMASSDNVLRGGLTPKHVDVPELRRVVVFSASDPLTIDPSVIRADGVVTRRYRPPVPEFQVDRIDLEPGARWELERGPVILLVLRGEAEGGGLVLGRGDSGFLAADEGAVAITASNAGATIFATSVPSISQSSPGAATAV